MNSSRAPLCPTSQIAFLEEHKVYGFRDKSEVVRAALERLRDDLLTRELDRSAEIYAEIYAEDPDSQAWVEDAARNWPE